MYVWKWSAERPLLETLKEVEAIWTRPGTISQTWTVEMRTGWAGSPADEPDCLRHGQLLCTSTWVNLELGTDAAGCGRLREERTLALENEMLGSKSTPSLSSICWTSDSSFISKVRNDIRLQLSRRLKKTICHKDSGQCPGLRKCPI